MNRKEINEIKGLFASIEECNILRLAGCYVNADKEKVLSFDEPFFDFPKEEKHKYLEIFRKSLSGQAGKNTLDMEFISDANEDADLSLINGRTLLEKMRKSELKDMSFLDEFYNRIIDTYDFLGNYLILAIYQEYDVPGKATDGTSMDDASDEVYQYVLCSICPLKLSKPGLGYDETKNSIHTLKQDYFVDAPDVAFLYPAFTDRSADTDKLLFYTKNTGELQAALIGGFLDCCVPMAANVQKASFTDIVTEVLDTESDIETVKNIHDNLRDLAEEKKKEANGEAAYVGKEEVKRVLEKSGVSEEKLESFDTKYKQRFTDESGTEEKIVATNIVPPRSKFEVKTPDVYVKVNSDKTDLVETRVIDGKKCLVIELGEGIVVNGIPINR